MHYDPAIQIPLPSIGRCRKALFNHMKEKDIKENIEAGSQYFVGVRFNKDRENYSVYLLDASKEFVDTIQIWAGDRDKVFSDPRRIIPWATKLGFLAIVSEDITL